jgi:hypothetical protein
MAAAAKRKSRTSQAVAVARCACGAVAMEIDYPAFWAWHDHSKSGRRAHGCVYATYVGTWRKRFRVVKGVKNVRRYEDKQAGAVRTFCGTCGTPLTLERARTPKWVNIPRGLFETRTGREPRYHLALGEAPEWLWRGTALSPLKGYPGVMWERPGRKPRMPPGEAL